MRPTELGMVCVKGCICARRRNERVDPEFGMDWDDELPDESSFKVKEWLKTESDSIHYEYDFGGGWLHKIDLEKVYPLRASQGPECA